MEDTYSAWRPRVPIVLAIRSGKYPPREIAHQMWIDEERGWLCAVAIKELWGESVGVRVAWVGGCIGRKGAGEDAALQNGKNSGERELHDWFCGDSDGVLLFLFGKIVGIIFN